MIINKLTTDFCNDRSDVY